MTHDFPASDRVSLTCEAGIAHLTLTRADKLNALDPAMIDALLHAGEALHAMAGLRCVVVSGEGRAFCAGLDLASIMAGMADLEPLPARTHGNANRFQQLAMQFRKLPVPVIAAVHGACFGGGLQIAAGADIRVATPDARLAVMEAKWGIVPDMGHFVLWRGLVREDALRELTYTAREFSGSEAQALGFVTHCADDPLARALAIAHQIAGRSPDAMREAKALFARAADGSVDEVLVAESVAQQRLLGSRNQMEAVRSGMEGRAADFHD